MSASAKKVAAKFIAAAKQNPEQAPEICRRAAETFIGLARDPRNAYASKQLQNIALDFAGAATRARPAVMDDFTDLLRETAIAYDEVGDDPMDLIARRREVHDDRTARTPGSLSIAPESFNRDATLGRSAVIKFAPTQAEIIAGILQSQNVAFWQGVKKEAQAMTVDVSLGFLPPLPPTFGEVAFLTNNRPYGEVEFGSDGNRTKVKFDIGTGRRLTVVGNYIAVTVGMDPPGFFDAPTTQLTVGASIGTFAAPSLAPLIKTEYIDQLLVAVDDFSPLSGPLITIPLRAVQLLPIQTNLPLGESLTLQFFDYGGNFINQIFYLQSATSSMPTIPLGGDVCFVRVHNTSTNTTAANVRLPFQLSS